VGLIKRYGGYVLMDTLGKQASITEQKEAGALNVQ
jgi:hypothetical protein